MKCAVFLDRDGCLIEERHYLSDPDEVVLIEGASLALKQLSDAGFELFLVTNQSGVGRGYFTLEDVARVHERLLSLLEEDGVVLKDIYIAPEAPDEPSRGRKPSPQFLFDARDEHGIDLGKSFMIGDKKVDVDCGLNAGVGKSYLVLTGHGPEWQEQVDVSDPKQGVVPSLGGAASLILANLDQA
ncbi:HAD family hydrolase [Verrucomicrobia bacterium]|nr:HAD family hydrolase [Verrucomicrobiota bacterium]